MPRFRLVLALTAATPAAVAAQETHIHGFVDVGFNASDRSADQGQFTLGQYVLHITSRLAERFTFMGESVFELDGGDFGVDVERIIVSYTPATALVVAAGKHHTPIGYWNNAYHHGTLIQPTIERPLMFKFEDDGGIFPVHTTGVLFAGRDISPLHLGFDLMLGNGIGSTSEQDNNRAKSFTVAAYSQVTSALKIGASAYFDRLAAGTATLTDTTLAEATTDRILGGFAALTQPRLELLAEYQHSTIKSANAGSHGTDAFYVYGGYRLGDFVAYGRYEEIRHAPGDPYYGPDDFRQGLLGGRYDFAATVTAKLELRRERLNSSGSNSQIAAQVAVGF
jgi:hypothetical protein